MNARTNKPAAETGNRRQASSLSSRRDGRQERVIDPPQPPHIEVEAPAERLALHQHKLITSRLIVQPKQRDGSLAGRFDELQGTDRTYRRCPYVMDEDAIQKRLRAGRVLKERDIRMACLIVQTFKNMMDMIDQQSPAVIEALLDFAEEMQEPDSPARKDRYAVRAALIQYVERALRQSRAREDQLFYGITGFEGPETR